MNLTALFLRDTTSTYLPHVRAFTLLYCEWHVDPCALSQSFLWLSNIPLSLDFARFVFVDLKVHWSLAHVVWLGLRVTSCILLLAFISQFVYLFVNHPISIPLLSSYLVLTLGFSHVLFFCSLLLSLSFTISHSRSPSLTLSVFHNLTPYFSAWFMWQFCMCYAFCHLSLTPDPYVSTTLVLLQSVSLFIFCVSVVWNCECFVFLWCGMVKVCSHTSVYLRMTCLVQLFLLA